MSDLISRQAVLNNIKNGFDWESVNGITAETVLKQVIHDVEIMPSVQAKQIEPEAMSDELVEHYRKLAEHYDKRNV